MIKTLRGPKGERVVAMYMKQDFTPCEEDKAEVVKLNYPDGRTVYLHPDEAESDGKVPLR